ncbi:MAG: OsmC-like protein [Promethearchaeota archaeon]|nr:MAG: OsmC-like protein [Candidatus Lokiarchaeota archaeon]
MEKTKELYIDETIDKTSKSVGPDAASLLGLAIISCLSASFLFCLEKRKLTLDDLEAHADISFFKNEKGYIRIKRIDVKIVPTTENPDVLRRVKQCIREMRDGDMYFEETCIITPSVKEGIAISVDVDI